MVLDNGGLNVGWLSLCLKNWTFPGSKDDAIDEKPVLLFIQNYIVFIRCWLKLVGNFNLLSMNECYMVCVNNDSYI